MSLHLVTGYAGEAHVTAAEVASFNRATIAESNRVFSKGNAFRAEMVDANTIRIYDGDMLLQGRHIILPEREYQDLTVDSGAVGRYRKDLVVIEYSRDVGTGVETAELKVLKGTAVTSQAQAQIPNYTTGNIDVELLTQFPLWAIPINEITVGTLEPMFAASQSVEDALRPPGVSVPDGTNIFDLIYPVGSIYMSVNPANPGTLFGGTWVAWGAGRVPVGINTSDTDFNSSEKTGGSKTHTLTASELPSHTHTYAKANSPTGSTALTLAQIPSHNHSVPIAAGVSQDTSKPNGLTITPHVTQRVDYATTSSGSGQGHTHTVGTTNTNSGATGSGSAHSIVQPYITCYMWKRTA